MKFEGEHVANLLVNVLIGDVEITNFDDMKVSATTQGRAKVARARRKAGITDQRMKEMTAQEFDDAVEEYLPNDPCPVCKGSWDWIDTNARTKREALDRGLLITCLNGDVEIVNADDLSFNTSPQGDARIRGACIAGGYDPDGFNHLLRLNMLDEADRDRITVHLTVDRCPVCNNKDDIDRWYRPRKIHEE